MFKSLISLTKCSTPTSSASKALTEQGMFLKTLSKNPCLFTYCSEKKAFVGSSTGFFPFTFTTIMTGFSAY